MSESGDVVVAVKSDTLPVLGYIHVVLLPGFPHVLKI